MDKARMAKDLSEHHDILGQLIRDNVYTSICLCFPLHNATFQSQINDTLTKGLERLSLAFPWLAGQVVREDVAERGTGLSKITPLDKTIRLIVKDLTQDAAVPSMDALRKANFPSSMLDGTLLAPLKGRSTSYEEDSAPVLILQANFINGGLLLNFAGEHSTMDGQARGEVVRIFSKACHNEPFTDGEILQGNRARDGVIPQFDHTTYKPGPEIDYLLVKPKATTTSTPALNKLTPKCTWAYFRFPSASLSKLKSIASFFNSISEKPTAPYITTNDAPSAFIWQSTSRIRSARLPPHITSSTFARSVDVRSSLSIPPSYLGNVTNHIYPTLPLSFVTSTSLGPLASSLRLGLKPSDLSFTIRSLATHVSLTPDKSKISYIDNLDLSADLFVSSWAKLACYKLEFNLGLGLPESVRRPRYAAIEGLMFFMPVDKIGGIDVLLVLGTRRLRG